MADEECQLLQLKTLTPDDLPPDVHTWKWHFACGQRYLVVGTGVRTDGCGIHKHGCTCRSSRGSRYVVGHTFYGNRNDNGKISQDILTCDRKDKCMYRTGMHVWS